MIYLQAQLKYIWVWKWLKHIQSMKFKYNQATVLSYLTTICAISSIPGGIK